jgi:5'-3' exonuclease
LIVNLRMYAFINCIYEPQTMGIRSLHKWIAWVCGDALLKQTPDFKYLAGKRVGIDILGFLYKANQDSESSCLAIARQILFWRSLGAEPVFVFDGKTPAEKQITRIARKKQKERLPVELQNHVTADDRNLVKRVLYATGCLFLNAEEEADSVLAYLARKGDIAAVISGDLDFLPRGVPTLIVPKFGKDGSWTILALDQILELSKLSYTDFVRMCVLLGCDYSTSIPTISYQSAYWAFRFGNKSLEEILKKEGIRDISTWERAERILTGVDDTLERVLSEKQREKWIAGASAVEKDALREMYGTCLSGLTDQEKELLSRSD